MYKQIPDAAARHLELLNERKARIEAEGQLVAMKQQQLEREAAETSAGIQQIANRYGLLEHEHVVTKSVNDAIPVGTVIDTRTKQPVVLPEPPVAAPADRSLVMTLVEPPGDAEQAPKN